MNLEKQYKELTAKLDGVVQQHGSIRVLHRVDKKLYHKVNALAYQQGLRVQEFLQQLGYAYDIYTPQKELFAKIAEYAADDNSVDFKKLPRNLVIKLKNQAKDNGMSIQELVVTGSNLFLAGSQVLNSDFVQHAQKLFDETFKRQEGKIIDLDGIAFREKYPKLYNKVSTIRRNLDVEGTHATTIQKHLTGYKYTGLKKSLTIIPKEQLQEMLANRDNLSNSERRLLSKQVSLRARKEGITQRELFEQLGINTQGVQKKTRALTRIKVTLDEATRPE